METANPFDDFAVPLPRNEPPPKAAVPAEKNPFDDFEDNWAKAQSVAPTFGESFQTNLEGAHGIGGLTATVADTAAALKAKSIISKGDTQGIIQPSEPFSLSSTKVTQSEYDNALQILSRQKDAYENYEQFQSQGVGGYTGALLGSVAGAVLDPTNLLLGAKPVTAGAEAGIRLLEQQGMNKVAAKIAVGAGEFGAFSAATDAAEQGLDMASGLQASFDAQRVALSAAIGAGLGGAIHTMSQATSIIKALKGGDPSIRPPARVEPPDLAGDAKVPKPSDVEFHTMTPEERAEDMALTAAPEPISAPAASPEPPDAPKINGVEIAPFVPKEPLPESNAAQIAIPEMQPSALKELPPAPPEFAPTEAWHAQPTPQNIPSASSVADMPKQAIPAPIGPIMFDAADLKTDAKTMQYKSDADESGVTSRLTGTNKWDPSASGRIVVFQRENGDMIVVNGHQRTGLAKRMLAAGDEKQITMAGDLYREADGYTAPQMRAIGAGINIKEGSGTSLDAARILRDYPSLLDGSFNISEAKTRESINLARLDDEAFRFVTSETVPEHFGGIVGEFIPNDGPRQVAAMKAIAKFKPASRDQAAALIQNVAASELAKAHAGAQGSMFGDFESAESTAGEQMRIVAGSIAELKSDKSLFARVSANADRIEQKGSTISRESARSAVQDAQTFAKFISTEAYVDGAIRDALKNAARELKNGSITAAEAARRFQSAVRSEAGRILHARDEAGSAGRGGASEPTAGAAIQKEGQGQRAGPYAAEPGADGKPQSLIPGVDPVTNKDRVDLASGKPMRGGDAAPGGMFDQSAMNQNEMFLRRRSGSGAHGPNPLYRRFAGREQLPAEAETIVGPKKGVTPQEARAHKINDAMRALAERLGARLEMDGRMSAQALGSFKPREGVLRIRYAGDFESFSHELGHKIDQSLATDPKTAQEWSNLELANTAELQALDYDAQITGGPPNVQEGAAEFMRRYINNPGNAAAEAPNTFAAFEQLLKLKPDIESILSDAAKISQVESGLDPKQVFSSMVAAGPKFGLEKLSQSMAKYGIVPTMQDYAANIYGALIRESVHFDRLTQFLRDRGFQKSGQPIKELSFATDPDHLFRQLPGAQQSAMAIMDRGVPLDLTDPINTARSPSLFKSITEALNGSISRVENATDPLVVDLNAYLIARRADGDWALFHTGKIPKPPVGASEFETIKAIRDFETQYPQFKDAADKIFSFQRSYLQRRVDKGLLSQESAQAMSAAHYDYVPLYRDFGDEKAGGDGGGAGGFASLEHSDMKQFSGSSRDVKNVIRSMIEDVGRTERRIAENDVLVAIDNLARDAGELAGPVWEHVPNDELTSTTVDVERALRGLARKNGMSKLDTDIMISNMAPMVGSDMTATMYGSTPTSPRGERILFMYKGGERQAIKVGDNSISSHFYDIMTSMSQPEKDIFVKTISAVNAGFQASITHAPRFLTGTAIRDNMTRMFIPRYQGILGRIPFAQDIAGAYTMAFDRAFYNAYAEGGGIRGGVYSHAANEAHVDPLAGAALTNGFVARTIDQLAQANTLGGKASVIVNVPWNAVKATGSYAESLWDRVQYKEGLPAKAWAVMTTPAKMVSDALRLAELSETASRVGNAKLTFNYLKSLGLSDVEALAGGQFESRDMLNYNSHGSNMRTMARIFPFMNAGLSGADRSVRGVIAEPVMAAVRAYQRGGYANLDARDKGILSASWKNSLYIAAGAGVVYGVYYPYASQTEFYRRASPYMKDTYFHIQTGEDADGVPVGLTIHKGYDMPAAIFNTAERLAEERAHHDSTDWGHVLGGLKEATPRQFRSWDGLLGASPAIKTAYEVKTGMRIGMDGEPSVPIIPRTLEGKPIEDQVTATTWSISKKIGAEFGVAPVVVDHVINGMGGTMGQDVRNLSAAVFDNNPLSTVKGALNKFFFGQIYRSGTSDIGAGHDLRSLMAKNSNSYAVQAKGYLDALQNNDPTGANVIYNKADDVAKTMMTMRSSSAFGGEVKQLHPLERSETIATALYGVMKDLGRSQILVQDRSQKKGDPRKVIALSDEQSRQLHAQLNSLMSEETRNGLAIAKYPGYEDYSIIDTSPRMDIIKSISPEAEHELASRLQRLHVLPALGVAKVWDEVKTRLLTDQRGAKLRDLVFSAKAGG